MTKEQAIERLKTKTGILTLTVGGEKTIETAIKALKEEPSEDAISRQAVEEMIKAEMPERGMWEIEGDKEKETVCEVCVDLVQKLSELPPVTQEPKTGHWIEYTRILIPEPFNSWEQAWYCSECGYGNQECEDGSAWVEWNYCPNCGAKMVESQESEGVKKDCTTCILDGTDACVSGASDDEVCEGYIAESEEQA